MKTTNSLPDSPADLAEAARIAATNRRDPEVMRQACERMDKMREDNLKEFGVQEIGVSIIRAIRDGNA